jgi:hypothetical protein
VQLEEHFYCTSTGCLLEVNIVGEKTSTHRIIEKLEGSNLVRKRAMKNFCLMDGCFYLCNHTNYLMHKNNE